ncbi:MAG: hypothetical protein ABI700_12135 [Chloroflexota bacterium]
MKRSIIAIKVAFVICLIGLSSVRVVNVFAYDENCDPGFVSGKLSSAIQNLKNELNTPDKVGVQDAIDWLTQIQESCYPTQPDVSPTVEPITPTVEPVTPTQTTPTSAIAAGSRIFAYQRTNIYYGASPDDKNDFTHLSPCDYFNVVQVQDGRAEGDYGSIQGWILTDALAQSLDGITVTPPVQVAAGAQAFYAGNNYVATSTLHSLEDLLGPAAQHNIAIETYQWADEVQPFTLHSGVFINLLQNNVALGNIYGFVSFPFNNDTAWLEIHNLAKALLYNTLETSYDSTSLRDKPDPTLNRSAQLLKGQRVRVVGIVEKDDGTWDGTWLKVDVLERAWVDMKDFMRPQPFTAQNHVALQLQTSMANVRPDPTVDNKPNAQVSTGTVVDILQVLPDQRWMQISFTDAKNTQITGWMNTCSLN